jgi:hypothetical protein
VSFFSHGFEKRSITYSQMQAVLHRLRAMARFTV